MIVLDMASSMCLFFNPQRALNAFFEADMESVFAVDFDEETPKDNHSTDLKRKSTENTETSNKRLKPTENTW